MTKQDKARNNTRPEKARQVKTIQDKARQDKTLPLARTKIVKDRARYD
jgi:hypothetical protein